MNRTADTERPQANAPTRRGLLAALISALLGAVPLGIGAAFFLSPLYRKKSDQPRGDDDFIPLNLPFDALPADGTPILVTVERDKQNAWNLYPDSPVGTVWLRRVEGQALAFNSICPHLGCAVEYRTAANDFFCPCHNSNFELDGERLNQIPPRSLDMLETKLVDGSVWVKYQNFRAGTAEKIEV